MLTGGKTYVGKAATVGGSIAWQDLTNTVATMTDPANLGYPAQVCGVAIEAGGNDAYVKVVTAIGTVWQTHGDINGGNFVWNKEWFQQTTHTPAVLVRGAFKGDLQAQGTPNKIPPGLKAESARAAKPRK
ncbi:hypothetical protein [Streptomyces sp. NBC_01264]|uniref:hypothetical protein n=1 Tax=Streptomyces sp. NBC_01264 TaxID=2903804 RepID=UPI00225791CB|nr:hypothetical protein [Streptomyces sp. NBC_01264]MCX4779580.1 hypothetical protein [Streptomyces sp. NBC_01264]